MAMMMVTMMVMTLMRMRISVNGGQTEITHILCLLSAPSHPKSFDNHIIHQIISNLLFHDDDNEIMMVMLTVMMIQLNATNAVTAT